MKYVIGLDIGITSVGWCVLNLDRKKIEDIGVRIFPAAEQPKDGESLAKGRREAAGARRRTQRKAERLTDIRNLFQEHGVLSLEEIEHLFQCPFEKSPYELRSDALTRRLSPAEWVRVLYHIAKHRGFQSNKKDTKPSKAKEEGELLEGVQSNKNLLQEKGYRTIGEMMFHDPKFTDNKRNKAGSYTHTVPLALLLKEVEVLFAEQERLGNPYTQDMFKRKYIDIFTRRLPYSTPEMIEALMGTCTFERGERRAPKMSWTAERFILLSKINNLQILDSYYGERSLNEAERVKLLNLAYTYNEVTYKRIRDTLSLDDSSYFPGIRYSKDTLERDKDERAVFVRLKGTHQLRLAVTKNVGKDAWEMMIEAPSQLDMIALALTLNKSNEDLRNALVSYDVTEPIIEAISELNFTGTVNLSFKALRNILPYMEEGMGYYDACKKAGYNEPLTVSGAAKSVLLPPDDFGDIRNPVVQRALYQTRKVLNAIIRKCGSPWSIHMELAREMGKSFSERKEIQSWHEDNRKERERSIKEFEENFERTPNGTDLLKYRLWKEQGGFDPYSAAFVGSATPLNYIDPRRLFHDNDGTYAEIDHIIPYSRSWDDSYTNKVLVLTEKNRNKKNRTPYEYLFSEHNTKGWENFVAWVESNIHNAKKRRNLLREVFSPENSREMTKRNITDTRYITRYLANYLENHLQFSDPSSDSKKVLRVNGSVTAALRWRWGLSKKREESYLHHAMDAAVVAAASDGMIQRITAFYQQEESIYIPPEDKRSWLRTPEPWDGFRLELSALLSENPADVMKNIDLGTYTREEKEALQPVFVSHMPVRKATGAAHDATIRSMKLLSERGGTYTKCPLENLDMKKLESMVGKERDVKLYNALKERLKAYDGKGKDAFKKGTPEFRKPTNDGSLGPIVRSIKIIEPRTSGVPVRGGLAEHSKMVRVDVYKNTGNGKFALIPYYVDDIARGIVKQRGILAHKDEKDWELITELHSFCFSLFPNDYIEITQGSGEVVGGYYRGVDRDNGRFTIASHDGRTQDMRVSVRTCQSIRKFQVGILGERTEVKRESPPQPRGHGVA